MKESPFTGIRGWLSVFAFVTVPAFLLCAIGNAWDFIFVDWSQVYDMGGRELGVIYLIGSFILNIPLIAVWTIYFATANKGRSDD